MKAGVIILISDKTDVTIKTFKRQRRTLYNDQGIDPKEDIKIVNIYAPNTGAPQYIRQLLTVIKGEINYNTIIMWDFNSTLRVIQRSSRQKINKATVILNDTTEQLDLIGILHPKVAEPVNLFRCTWNNLQDRSHIRSQNKSQQI